MTDQESRRAKWMISAGLAAAVVVAFWPAFRCGFVYYDDPAYVTNNLAVQDGLSWRALLWAMTDTTDWHPITWVSHMLDVQLFRMNPAGHHATSVLFHLLNSILLFWVLCRMTGALWRSAMATAFFALHPLRVESVVWISERKDVLSIFFWLLTIWAYARYTEERRGNRAAWRSFYAAAILLDALGLMSKPMLVTMPLFLLLIDWWPLRRVPPWSRRLLIEKTPFVLLTLASCVLTYISQTSLDAIVTTKRFPLMDRLATVPLAYAAYLLKIMWPLHLAAFYPHPKLRAAMVAAAVVLIGLISAFAWGKRHSQPYLIAGWLWFLVVLVPVIDLVQAGGQFIADRYTYFSSVGISIMVVWGLYEFAGKWALGLLSPLMAICLVLTRAHVPVYHDTGTLWAYTLRYHPDCLAAHYNLGKWYFSLARYDDTIAQSRAILEAEPHDPLANATIAECYLREHKFADAAAAYRESLAVKPAQPEAWCNLGFALLQMGHVPEAAAAYQKALELDPSYALAHNDLGNILLRAGHIDEALSHFTRAAEIMPDFAEAHYNIGQILLHKEDPLGALAEFRTALRINPGLAPAKAQIDKILAHRGVAK